MFNSTEDFYHSRIWRDTREYLYNARLNEKDELICQHCGEPIVLKYDAILHHITELDNINVNDANISLNPDNLIWVHHKCHREIHNVFGFNKKEVYVVYGSSCSGKSTYVNNVAKKDDIVVDMDKIWQCISINPKYIKPNTLKNIVFAIRSTIYEQVKMRSGNWNSCYVIATMPRVMERKRLCDLLGAKEIFVDTDKETCIKRLHENPNGRNIEEYYGYINDFFNDYQPTDLIE